jgi:uncharacterized membrane protein
MQPPHEPYCDQQHAPRQRCNDALAPAPDPVAAYEPPAAEAEPIAAAALSEPMEAEPASSAVRDIAGEAPIPTSYAGREWRRAAASLEAPDYLASDAEHALDVAKDKGARIAGKLALVAGGLAVAGVAAYLLRDGSLVEAVLGVVTGEGRRGGGRDDDGDRPPADAGIVSAG